MTTLKKLKISGIVFLSLIVMPIVVAFDDGDDFETLKNLAIFHDIIRDIKLYYVDEKNSGEIIRDGIDKMLENMDPYTNFYPESDIVDYTYMSTGAYGGVGAVVEEFENQLVIRNIYQNFPADKAHLKVGDQIIEIGGHSVNSLNYKTIKEKLYGEAGSVLVLKIKRFGTEQAFEINIKRESIKNNNVAYYGITENNIGYIKLSGFMSGASNEFKNAFLKLKSEHTLNGLIIDLCDNPGGLLVEAVDIVNFFVEKGKSIVFVKGKNKDKNQTFIATHQALDSEIPLIVLVNSKSASASEIVSGALQDLDRAIIIGKRTFGKGLVQTTLDLSYNAKLKITTAKYYIPSGRCIQALDYTHRNADGSVGKIPDSLITEFKTLNKRTVYDGGGITPDIVTSNEKSGKLIDQLVAKSLIFNYVTEYVYNMDTISSPTHYQYPDEDFSSFVQYIVNHNFSYETETEKLLCILDSVSETESVDTQTKNEIKHLKSSIKIDIKDELYKEKNSIKNSIEEEVIQRFYYQNGVIEYNLKRDLYIKTAVKVFSTTNEYESILKNLD